MVQAGVGPQYGLFMKCFGRETDGRGLGINFHDQISGDLTINLGVFFFKIEQQKSQDGSGYSLSAVHERGRASTED